MSEETLNTEHSTLEAHLKKTSRFTAFVSSAISVFTAFVLVTGAYYKIKDTIEDHTYKIEKIEAQLPQIKATVDELKLNDGVTRTEIRNIQKNLEAVDNKLDKVNDKLDKILMQTRN
jgi:chromosome segregation ATPase